MAAKVQRLRRLTVGALILAVALAVGGVAPPSVAAPPPTAPVLVYSGADEDGNIVVRTARSDGTVLNELSRPDPYLSLFATINGGLVAHTPSPLDNSFVSRVILRDAVTGDVRHRIRDARYPLVVWGGTGVVFLPDNFGVMRPGERDPFANSVWFRDLKTGAEHRLHQFDDPDRGVDTIAASPRRDQIAYTHGNDVFLFEWDIYAARPDGTGQRRLTTDGASRAPSFSPGGRRIAFQKQHGFDICASALAVMRRDGSGQRIFYEGTCERSLVTPVWVGPQRVAALWWQSDPDFGARPRGIVLVDTGTGQVTKEIVEAPVVTYAVSRRFGLLAFRLVTGQLGLFNLRTDELRWVEGGEAIPGSQIHLEGSFELNI